MKDELSDYHEYGASTSKPSNPAGGYFGHLWASITATVILTIICCGVYPAIVYGIAQIAFPVQANGSLIQKDGKYTTKDSEAVGSAMLGQNFSDVKYFHPRPSSAGNGYDAANSSGSNLGPLSDKLINGTTKKDEKGVEVVDFDGVKFRILQYALDNGIEIDVDAGPALATFKDAQGNYDGVKLINAFKADKDSLVFKARTPIPADAVTASGSGLDPHVSPANAVLQGSRVAKARGMTEGDLQRLVRAHTDNPDLGILGEPGVNVLMLNLALDSMYPVKSDIPATSATRATTRPAP